MIEREYSIANGFKSIVALVILVSLGYLGWFEGLSIFGWCAVAALIGASWAHAFVSAKIHQLNEEQR